ncbi:GntR family transcriptional regulator [Nonomuraea sp. NPDC050394]|uniref:GntR family transcriptional regulator n=1 Tax=Nonomuraea sp. NPDC050394 TaxID=3364363 RepID=UPI00378A008F
MADHTQASRRRVVERRPGSLPAMIVEDLENLIISGALKGGDRINESALAERLGVSRGPVREACRRLERGRLAEFRVNRGMFVREISAEQAAQLYDIRAGLFTLAGRLAAENAAPAVLEALTRQVAELGRCPDIGHYYPRNVDLHRALVALSGNPRLGELYDDTSKELHLYRRQGLDSPEARAVSNAQHERIVAAIAARDPTMAAKLMEEHILTGKQRLLAARPHA